MIDYLNLLKFDFNCRTVTQRSPQANSEFDVILPILHLKYYHNISNVKLIATKPRGDFFATTDWLI